MTPEKQILVIAEACGWTDHFPTGGGGILLPYKWCNIHTNKKSLNLPDYLNDLNAMYEAEKTLGPCRVNKAGVYAEGSRWGDYFHTLLRVCEKANVSPGHPSAAQRAEAFLKTIGKWEE